MTYQSLLENQIQCIRHAHHPVSDDALSVRSTQYDIALNVHKIKDAWHRKFEHQSGHIESHYELTIAQQSRGECRLHVKSSAGLDRPIRMVDSSHDQDNVGGNERYTLDYGNCSTR